MKNITTKTILTIFIVLLCSGLASALPNLYTQNGDNPRPFTWCNTQSYVLAVNVHNIGDQDATNLELGVYFGDKTNPANLVKVTSGKTIPAGSVVQRWIVLNNVQMDKSIYVVPDPNNKLAKQTNYYDNWLGSLSSSNNKCNLPYNPVSLKRYYHSSYVDHVYTQESMEGKTPWVPTGYSFSNYDGQPSSTLFSGAVYLYRMQDITNHVNYYTTSGTEVEQKGDSGYTFWGIEGFLYPTAGTGRTPLYKLYNPTQKDTLLTINWCEYEQVRVQSGWENHGIIGYVVGTDPCTPTPKPDLTPVDIFTSNSLGRIESTIYCNVQNIGASTSSSFNINLYIDGFFNEAVPVAGISENEIKTASFAHRVLQPGTHSIKCKAVAPFDEESTLNNERTESLTWQVPPLPAPRPAQISNTTPNPGDTITYVLHYDAYPLSAAYRTFVHLKDDSDNIIVNDDHWSNFSYPYTLTNSQYFYGGDFSFYGRTRSITIPSNFSGHLRMVTGFYPEASPGSNVQMRSNYAQDIGNYQYLIGQLDVPTQVLLPPAPKPASFSKIELTSGEQLTYTYSIEAHKMDNNYRTMVHFVDDQERIVVNDDHWTKDIKGFNTSSTQFNGIITYSRTITLPSDYSGTLSMITGFYDLDNPDIRVELDSQYVEDFEYNRYKVGQVDVYLPGVGGPDELIQEMIDTFPELFQYTSDKNANLAIALLSVSGAFNDRSIVMDKELLAAVMATLLKEVPGSFSPVEEYGDYGMGPGCTYKINFDGVYLCRSTPYDGGIDYKGRGYIQITHKYNYQKYCGADCIGTSDPSLDVCQCKNRKYCNVQDDSVCPQVKALNPAKAGDIFAYFYTDHNLVQESQNTNYWNVGKTINGGDAYATSFQTIANSQLAFLQSNILKTNALIALLNNGMDPYGIPYSEGERLREEGDNKIYLFENGKFRHIADETSFCYNFNTYNLDDHRVVLSGEISQWNSYGTELTAPLVLYTFPLPPQEGTLLKEACSPEVYLYTGGQYHWIVDEYTFHEMGLSFNDVITVAHGRISSQNAEGEPIQYTPKCTLPTKHQIPVSVTSNYDINWQNVVVEPGTIFSNPLDQVIEYNPSSTSCADYKICNHYRGDYYHNGEGSGSHAGIDVLAPAYTTKVYAFADGIVVKDEVPTIRDVLYASTSRNGGYGGMVILKHDQITLNGRPLYSAYLHMREFNPELKIGGFVKAGTYLGILANDMYSDDTLGAGYSTDPHMHFQIDREPISGCIDQFNQVCAWPYEPQTFTNVDDKGYLNNMTVNPMKLLNRIGYYMPSELAAHYDCTEQTAYSGPDSPEIENLIVLDVTQSIAKIDWDNTAAPTYTIALSKEPEFLVPTTTTTLTGYPTYEVSIENTPTYVMVKSPTSIDWSPQIIVNKSGSVVCGQLDGYISSFKNCGLNIENSDLDSTKVSRSTLKDLSSKNSTIKDSVIIGKGSDFRIEDAYVEDNVMHSGRISWNGLYFEGRLDLSKINLDCMATTDVDISGQTKIRLCSGDYNDNINISSSNVEIDLNGAELTGGVVAYSRYNLSEVESLTQGVDPTKLSRQEINDLIDTIPRFENITIKNGIFNGKGLNLSAVKNAVILDNGFTDSGLFLGVVNSEVRGNTFSGSGDNAILIGGGDSLVVDNSISGSFEQAISAAGFNITVDSNTISGTNKGIGALGMWHNILNNDISDVNEGVSGLFFVESIISGNTINADYGLKGTCIGANDINGNIFETSDGIQLNKFLRNKCSGDNTFIGNCFVDSDSINIMGSIIFNGDDAYDTVVEGNVVADDAGECQVLFDQQNQFSNPLFWQHQYNVIYEPGELRDISDVELASNIKNVSSWDIVDMQEIDGFYYFGFDDISAGEKVLTLRYMVQGVSYDYYYAVSTQGLSGTIYINGEPLDCGYAHYFPPLSANYKVVMDGQEGFSP
ncbi:MAG: peptidoglycan DD-metalloendopeptidase family protein, partial [Nanoarchaeota archaeon]|nr:peptidoglycan DD-metalloendopeptidase family protein [Nanoarchaeota archaeon]